MKAREQELREKQIKALLVKKEQEVAATVKEQQRQESKEKYQAKLDEWAMEKGGEKKNIRTLLSTVGIERGMHQVMWEGADFQPISLAQLLQPEKVKLYYRKAMLKVHPDKNRDGTPDQIYIAQRIFEALNQAWATFQDQQKYMINPFEMI
ncbi:uncharacterized protein [Blastocystis hominis]|uniref:J domain-containing protein n=1 Tax=Blastocystis hominis TaxID=12968 RepID=D8LVM2_BLAHO|nr:uncharacterized protein [Blastocystis hominis]CBK19861.2 unnamed protein product [Blastocystis hominis]|eukprot:XP_012893909.1 uncharacterized protein [Blastocystis hominis]